MAVTCQISLLNTSFISAAEFPPFPHHYLLFRGLPVAENC